ncbi:hypothetical protein L227DRAFT_53849 [Lentinus tigrinus ALCF2SS1-6]|uniref:Uncharacterized protein n=1 Tax=Lentinus tigrinus ALCF2SS1-6 TaxID=1328759 RepID=A0A5C2SCS2_9APHY|nr:hypothetical protein L227DRAFT_53849 [Lentinus tigrinus ALCF2SS1-6]
MHMQTLTRFDSTFASVLSTAATHRNLPLSGVNSSVSFVIHICLGVSNYAAEWRRMEMISVEMPLQRAHRTPPLLLMCPGLHASRQGSGRYWPLYLCQTGESAVTQASSWWTYSGEKGGTARRRHPLEGSWGSRPCRHGARVSPRSTGTCSGGRIRPTDAV